MQRIQKGTILISTLMLLLSCFQAQALWYQECLEDGSSLNGSDIIMMDLRWPWWPSATYFANWNTGFNPKPNNLSFYAGIQSRMPDGPNSTPNPDQALQQALRPTNTWSVWGWTEDGTPPRFVDAGPTLSIVNAYGGEGTSAYQTAMPWPFIKCDRWYTMLGRVWQPVGGADHAYCGRWIKDHADGKWHLMGVAWLPIPATSFHGNCGFLEPLTSPNAVRSLHRRLGYSRKDGDWKKANVISTGNILYAIVNVVPEGDHEYTAIEYSQRPDLLPIELKGPILAGDKNLNFKAAQPDLPVLDKPVLSGASAVTTGSQIAVSWEIPATSSPAFSYKIEIFDNSQCKGSPVAVKEERMPSTRRALLDAKVASPTVRLTITDIFDQAAKPMIMQATPAKPAPRRRVVSSSIPGLTYELLHKDTKRKVNFWKDPKIAPNEEHYWLTLSEIGDGGLFRKGLARGFDYSVLENRKAGYALKFNGLLRVPANGLYILHAQIDGAYQIKINGKEVILRDGQYGASRESSIVRLSRGDQSLEVIHLFDSFPGLREVNFNLEWEGPGLERQPIPLEALRIADDGNWPSVAIRGLSAGDGTGKIKVHVKSYGKTVNKTVLFLGDLELASGKGAGLEFNGPLPAGDSEFWSRIVFDGNGTVDSKPFTLKVTGKPVSQAWTLRNVGNSNDSAGIWQTDEKDFQFFGEGMHTVTQPISGDFTATCRIDNYSGKNGEPVNPTSWVGLSAFEKCDGLNWNWRQYFYFIQTAGVGQRVVADYSDLAATRMSSYVLPSDKPWLRIVRQGNVWTAWNSSEGKKWELVGHQFRRTPEQMGVGLFIRALGQDSHAHFQARISEFSIEPGIAPETAMPVAPVARNTDGDRLTGVVMARSDANVAVVRSSSFGLLRTTDGGAIWNSSNGDLAGGDLAVRSVAIHPTNPPIMLRACGVGEGKGSLWKTTDGGTNWVKLDFPGDFDGIGPSALCGEVVAFDVYRPDTVYAGTESKGFFRSTDAGATWSELKLDFGKSLAGRRITSMTQWPWFEHHPMLGDVPRLCLTTAGDHWMGFLGRGKPNTTTREKSSLAIFSRQDIVERLQVAHERIDTGFYNAINDVALMAFRGEMRYATTHGLQAEYTGRNMTIYSESKNLESLRPMTAIGAVSRGVGQKFGRSIAQVLDPVTPGRLSLSKAWAFSWQWRKPQGSVSKGGLIAACGDEKLGQKWWFLYTDGLYYSPDCGKTMQKVLGKTGRPAGN